MPFIYFGKMISHVLSIMIDVGVEIIQKLGSPLIFKYPSEYLIKNKFLLQGKNWPT